MPDTVLMMVSLLLSVLVSLAVSCDGEVAVPQGHCAVHSQGSMTHDSWHSFREQCCIVVSGHTHQELKLDCAFTPSDAHVMSGSEDGKEHALFGSSVMANVTIIHDTAAATVYCCVPDLWYTWLLNMQAWCASGTWWRRQWFTRYKRTSLQFAQLPCIQRPSAWCQLPTMGPQRFGSHQTLRKPSMNGLTTYSWHAL